jgi:hypothetical protein
LKEGAKAYAVGSIVPALRKLRDERGTHFVVASASQRPGHPSHPSTRPLKDPLLAHRNGAPILLLQATF